MADYYASQQARQELQSDIEIKPVETDESEKIDLDSGEIENLKMDNEEEADVLDEQKEL